MTAPRLALIALPLIAAILYWPSRTGDFVFDDQKLVVENQALWQGAGFDVRVFSDQSDEPVRINYRPVRFASYKLDALLSEWWYGSEAARTEPLFFHLQNILLHALNTLLLGLLVRKVAPACGVWGAAAFALAFALHPVQTESVAYISGRRDVLFLFFYLLALHVYVSRRGIGDVSRAGQTAAGRGDRAGWGTGLIIALLYLLAVGAKEMALSLPFALVACDLIRPDRLPLKKSFCWPVLVPTAAVGALSLASVLFVAHPGEGAGFWGGTLANALATSARAQLYYLRLLLWPEPLTVDYSYNAFPVSQGWFDPISGLFSAAAILALLGVGVYAWRKGNRWSASGIWLYFASMFPVAQIVPHPERMAEHHLYLPIIFALLAIAGAARMFCRGQPAVAAVAGLLVLWLWGSMTHRRLEDWQDPYHLWKSATEVAPECARAQFALGYSVGSMPGGGAPARDEAIQALTRSIAILESIPRRSKLEQGYFLQACYFRALHFASYEEPRALALARADFARLLVQLDTDGTKVEDNPQVLHEWMKLLVRLSELERADEAARKLLTLPGTRAKIDAYLLLSQRARAGGDWEQAWRLLEDAESCLGAGPGVEPGAVPPSPAGAALSGGELLQLRGQLAFQRGLYFEARTSWDDAIREFHASAQFMGEGRKAVSAYFKESACLAKAGRNQDAAERLRGLLVWDEDHLAALLSLGNLTLAMGELDEAEKCFVHVLKLRPEEESARQGLVHVKIKQAMPSTGDGASAERDVFTMRLLADKKLAEGKLEDALIALAAGEKAALGPTLRADRLAFRLDLARVNVRLQRWPDARVAYESYLQLAEGAAERVQAALEAAEVARRAGDISAGYELLLGEWQKGTHDKRLAKNLGGLAAALSRAADARRWYETYLQEELTESEREAIRTLLERIPKEPEDHPGQDRPC